MLTADDFLAGDFPPGSELVDGEMVMNDPGFTHQELALRIVRALARWTESAAGHGRAGFGGNWVLAPRQVYKPDAWWAARPPTGSRNEGPPDLAVEVRSTGTWLYDVGPKLREYEAAGTRELWLVDTPARTVLGFRRNDQDTGFDADQGGGELTEGQQLISPLLPGFSLDVAELFATTSSTSPMRSPPRRRRTGQCG